MSNYHRNKDRAIFRNVEPTLTEQDQASETDINTIVRRGRATGMAVGSAKEPIYEDFSKLPRGLRDMIHQARGMNRIREQLPKELKDLPTERLLTLTPAELTNILTPAPPPEPKKEEVK